VKNFVPSLKGKGKGVS